MASLLQSDISFVVASQTLRIAEGIGMAEAIRGTVWVGRTGRTSLDFYNVFRRIKDNALLVEGCATIVYLGTNGLPTPLPARMQQPDPDPPSTIDLEPPVFSNIPQRLFQTPYRVRTSDIDLLSHMNHASYGALYEDAMHCALAVNAYGPGISGESRIRFLHIEYANSALLGQKLSAGTWLVSMDPVSLGFVLHCGDTLLSRAVALL
ncbi:MAG: hypothetical protein P8Z37_07120 [Acidobacteriota bacterium]